MSHSYVAFIDESGDDGFKNFRVVGGRGGSSHWLVISALLFRKSNYLQAVKWRDEIVAKMPDKKSRELHFANLNHGQKLAAVQTLAEKPVRAVSVISCKNKIPDGVYSKKNQLYFYLCRYLIERVSWLCRDLRPQVPEGNGQVAIVFSRRGGMNYGDFREYLNRLKDKGDDGSSIHWPVIDIGAVDAQDHSRNASLQLADIVASSISSGLEIDLYGNCEERFGEVLRPITYNRQGNYLSYGIKILPNYDECDLNKQQLRMINLWQ